jgi:hypothetical protein
MTKEAPRPYTPETREVPPTIYNSSSFRKYYHPQQHSSWGLTDVAFCLAIAIVVQSWVVLQCIL